MPDESVLRSEFRADMLSGIQVIMGEGVVEKQGKREPINIEAIPYYAWAHRGPGEMAVWLDRN